MDLNETLRWILARGVGLLIGTVVLLVIYRVGLTLIHRLVPTVISAQAAHLPSGSSSADEVGKRIGTIEDLLQKLLRLAVLAGFVIVVLAVFDLWAILAAIVVIVVAVVFATQDVVLDYVMGFLILVEGPYFKGDYVTVGGQAGTEGVVEEIGLRRTVLRDATGASNAVSNGLIRLSTNLTRLYSVAVVDLYVLRADQLDAALAARDTCRGRAARGRGMGRQVPRGCADQRLGHRHRHGRRFGQAPAAGPRRRPGRRRQ